MENTLQSWLDETLSEDNDAKSAADMMDIFALAKGIPGEVAAFLFGIRQAGAFGRSNAETNLDEFDYLPWQLPEGILDVLKKPAKAVSPRQKAFAWLHYARNMETVRHLATLSLLRVPGCDDFRNLSSDAFSTVAYRPGGRTSVEFFLRGMETGTGEALAFLGAAAKPAQVFTPRQMLLYACAHCRSVERFAWILDKLRPKLGKADFMDALGYSPFFYTALREDSIVAPAAKEAKDVGDAPEDDGPRPLTRPQMREFLDLLRKAGARPDRKCRFGFSWEDVEAVAEEYAAGQRPRVSWRRLEARKRASGNRREKEPVPSPDEIRRLLADYPTKALHAIKRMDCLPESLERPFSPRELLVSDLICDRSLPKASRAQLLRSIAQDLFFDGLPPIEARDVPLGFLDSRAGRKWYCEHGRPGCEVVRCSDPAFYRKVARKDCFDEVDADKVKIDPKLRKTIDADSPAQLMMQLSVSGKNMDARLLAVILTLRKTKILEWLMENDGKTKEFLDERRMLFYVCANWKSDDAIAWLEKAEAKEPGIVKSCVDALGRNLLWYTLFSERYSWRHKKLPEFLVKYGCDPDADTAFGLSWRDMEAVR